MNEVYPKAIVVKRKFLYLASQSKPHETDKTSIAPASPALC